MVESREKSLAELLFSLDEPWRSRFLSLVAKRTIKNTAGLPTKAELVTWLKDGDLYCDVRALLRTWSGSQL